MELTPDQTADPSVNQTFRVTVTEVADPVRQADASVEGAR